MLKEKLFLYCDDNYTGNCGRCGHAMTSATESTENGGYHAECDPDVESDEDSDNDDD